MSEFAKENGDQMHVQERGLLYIFLLHKLNGNQPSKKYGTEK